jgi:hypothetical protein
MKDMQQTPTRGYRQLRKGRHSIPGFYYSLTVCTLDKRPLLANTEPRLMQSFKSFTVKEINARLGRSGSLWQDAYYEHGIRRDESLKAIIRYCDGNRMRREK